MKKNTTNPETTQAERDTVKKQFIWVVNTLQNQIHLYSNDVTVTVKYSNNPSNHELAHLAVVENGTEFRLGVHFTKWRRLPPESRLEALIHEAGHTRHEHHEQEFWEFVFDMWEQVFNHKQAVISWANTIEYDQSNRPPHLETPIDWEYLKGRMLDDVHDNAQHHHRQQLIDAIEPRLAYNHAFVRGLDWPCKLGGAEHTPATHDWDTEPTPIDMSQIEFSQRYDDKTLYERLRELEVFVDRFLSTPSIHGNRTENGLMEITENELDAAVFARQRPGTLPVILDA